MKHILAAASQESSPQVGPVMEPSHLMKCDRKNEFGNDWLYASRHQRESEGHTM